MVPRTKSIKPMKTQDCQTWVFLGYFFWNQYPGKPRIAKHGHFFRNQYLCLKTWDKDKDEDECYREHQHCP
eukprot:jgi/Psemu1/34179/gm1.34179_g